MRCSYPVSYHGIPAKLSAGDRSGTYLVWASAAEDAPNAKRYRRADGSLFYAGGNALSGVLSADSAAALFPEHAASILSTLDSTD